MLRRRLLQGTVASAGVLGLGAALDAGLAGAALGRTRVTLGYVGNACEAATFTAPKSAIFRRNDLAARLVPFDSDEALVAAIAVGKVDAASVALPTLLGPLERGKNVRVGAGLHAGCLRVVAPEDVIMRSFATLKGAKIATDRLHGPSMNLLSALMRRQGVDPQRDVRWHVYSPADLEPALQAKAVDCVAASDPLGYFLLVDKKAEPFIDTADGGFACGNGIGGGHHCFLALNGRLVDSRPAVAASLTRAYLGASAAIGRGVGPAALTTVRDGYAPFDLSATIGMLSSYKWEPSTDYVLQELELTANDFRRSGLLKSTTDPERLAERAFADVLHG